MIGFKPLAPFAALALAVSPLAAQSVSGLLRSQATGEPVGGAYVVLLDPDSLEVTRALSNALGRFTLFAPRAGTYRLRTEVVGFRSSVSTDFELEPAGAANIVLEIEPLTLRLSALRVEGRARECRVIGEQALEVLTVWEEARKVLTAVAWTDLQEHFLLELERFERTYNTSYVLRLEERTPYRTRHAMPFRSRSVEELQGLGYVVLEGDSALYEAPDAEVFFSTPFLQNHCFSLVERSSRSERLIGLRFEPVGGHSLPDVRGTFWIDAESAALRRLELSYVNVGVWQLERGAAAELEFERMPDGRWIVSRWWIRMPVVRKVESLKGPIWDFKEAVVGFREQGGEVRRVFAPDGRTTYARNRATVRGTVVDSTTGNLLAGAYVRLAGTDFVTVSDVDGSYWLTDLPEGQYAVTFSHPRASLLGVTDRKDVTLRLGTELRMNLALPPSVGVVERRCSTGDGQGLLVGRVRRAVSDSLVTGAAVTVTWLPSAEGPMRSLETRTDSLGVYRACVPTGAPLSVEVYLRGELVTAVPAVFGESPLHHMDIELRRPEAGSARPAESPLPN